MSLSWIFLLMILAWARPSFAAEEHGASIQQLFFPLINFLIFLYLLKRFLVPVIADHLRTRRDHLMSALEEAQEKKRGAEAAHRSYQERLKKSPEEARGLTETLRADAERQKAKMISEAEEMARKITLDAQFQVEQEVKVARQRVRRELAGAARTEAEKLIRRHIEPGDQERLVEEFLSRLEGIR